MQHKMAYNCVANNKLWYWTQ